MSLAIFWGKAINFHLLGTAHYYILKLSGEGKTCLGSPAGLRDQTGPYYSICLSKPVIQKEESTETVNRKTTQLQGPDSQNER